MYTVKFETDATIVTSLDEDGKYDDVQVIIGDEGGVYIRQFDLTTEEHSTIYISYLQFIEIYTALNSTEGAFRVELKA